MKIFKKGGIKNVQFWQTLEEILTKEGYKIVKIITKDNFNRFNALLTDKNGEKYFMKATWGSSSYRYKSLLSEAKITAFLSKKIRKKPPRGKHYSLSIPKAVKIINRKNILIFITEYIKGESLVKNHPRKVSKIVAQTIILLRRVTLSDSERVNLNFKNYSKFNLFFTAFLRLLKSVTYIGVPFVKLMKVYKNIFLVFRIKNSQYSIVHPDINVTNIIIKGKMIYLTDWEEVGWGIPEYNITTPLLLYSTDRGKVQEFMDIVGKTVPHNLLLFLLSYRVLVLFNQPVTGNIKRHKRDLKILDIFLHKYSK